MEYPTKDELLALPAGDKLRRFDAMIRATFSHVDGRDLLAELHPRSMLDIERRADGRTTRFEGDWLTNLMAARDGLGAAQFSRKAKSAPLLAAS